MSPIKEKFAKKYKTKEADIDEMLRQIGFIESENRNVSQEGGGPGRGIYQFEKTAKDKETGEYVQAGGLTARNRLAKLYRDSKKPVPKWLTEDKNEGQPGMFNPSIGFDASKLTKEQQDELILANFAQNPKATRELIKKGLGGKDAPGKPKELWLQAHWSGAKVESPEYGLKADYWDKRMSSVAHVALDKSKNNESKKKDTDQQRAENGVFRADAEANEGIDRETSFTDKVAKEEKIG